MKPYPDSNFLARYYLDPTLLAPQVAALKKWGMKLSVFWLHRFEVSNAFLHHAFTSMAGCGPRVSPEWSLAVRGAFLEVFKADGDGAIQEVALSPAALWRQFDELSLRHTAARGYRTYDLIHVSAALLLDCDTFWSFDKKANDLAKREGLDVIKT